MSDETETCTWERQESGVFTDDNVWATECDNAFLLIHGTPTESDMLYCCYCGNKILEGCT